MIIKSLTALTALILEAFGVYCEGEFKWGCGYVEATLTSTVLTYRLSLKKQESVSSMMDYDQDSFLLFCLWFFFVGTLIWQLF